MSSTQVLMLYALLAPIFSGWPPILPSLMACKGFWPTNAALSAVANPPSTYTQQLLIYCKQ